MFDLTHTANIRCLTHTRSRFSNVKKHPEEKFKYFEVYSDDASVPQYNWHHGYIYQQGHIYIDGCACRHAQNSNDSCCRGSQYILFPVAVCRRNGGIPAHSRLVVRCEVASPENTTISRNSPITLGGARGVLVSKCQYVHTTAVELFSIELYKF